MKKVFLVMVVFLASTSFANSLNIAVSQDENGLITLAFSTVERMSSICHMSVNRMTLDYGRLHFTARNLKVENGRISFRAATDPLSMCLMAFGPHRGVAGFQRGYSLPGLREGRYQLRINGENYGALIVEEKSVRLESNEE